MSEIELKPCPFCGNKAKFVKRRQVKDIIVGFVICTGCRIRTNQENYTEELAAHLWNTRKGSE